jgi:predicted phosphodiesterase
VRRVAGANLAQRSDGVAVGGRLPWSLAMLGALLLALAAPLDSRAEVAQLGGTRFVVVGHTYGLLKTPDQRQQLIERVNAEGVDRVFILGDADLWDPMVARQYRSRLTAPFYAAPGNHDLEQGRKAKYLESVGYLNQTITAEDVNFILIDSSDDVVRINEYLETALAGIDDSRITVLLTHHRIWDDGLRSDLPYQHDKSYRFSELNPQLEEKVDYIFAGNSPAQYFTDPYNPHIVYWSDVVRGIPCYSAGVAWSDKLTYLVVRVVGSELMITPRSVPLPPHAESSEAHTPRSRGSVLHRALLALRSRRFLAGVACGFLAFAAASVLWRRRGSLPKPSSRA